MPKVSVNNLKPGMKLSKPVVNEAGMILLGEGTEITDSLIERLQNMNVSSVYVEEGASKPQKSKEDIMAEIDARFKKTENEPHMGMLKKLFKEHVEELYK
ncbi:MAG: hypothetical protein M0Z70_12220 [Nitrospiraceae bacterium]|nr:hypothetical protein [Nitrospirota bacterium]MDA8340056.1 hypothetical protein [Nitrospiraceae bacterium]